MLAVFALVGATACPSGAGQRAGRSVAHVEPQVDVAPISIVAWNTNSGINADRAQRDQQLPSVLDAVAAWADREVIALSEVGPHWMDRIANRLSETGGVFGSYRGTTGCNQRLAVFFDSGRFELVERDEMTGVPDGRNCARAPLALGLRERASGLEFDLVAVHLLRGSGSGGARDRAAEASRLRHLLERRGDRPVVVVGDFNFDCPLATAPRGCAEAFDAAVEGGLLRWVEPAQRRETTCSTRYDDMLDLAFVGRGAEAWSPVFTIEDDRAWCERMQGGAHFPIYLELDP